MDLPGSSYLISLAVVSTTYVGLSALLVGLRQANGSHLTSYDAYFTHTFIEVGFIVTVSELVPSLIALYGWSPNVVWRLSSALAAIPILLFAAVLPSVAKAAASYATAVTLVLITSGLAYLLALRLIRPEIAQRD
jgi:hypothetical protein